jgi:major capsid protein
LITTTNSALAPGASITQQMNATNLDAIPRRLLIQVRRQDSDLLTGALNYTYTDTCARINNITINWANNQGKLSSAQISDLYTIYRSNGGNESWPQWSQFSGSILPIDLGRDIGLDSLSAPGKLANPQLSMTVNYTNINPTQTITFSLCVFVIYEGTYSVIGGNVTKNISVLTSQDVLNAAHMENSIVEHTTDRNMYGGGLWDKIKSALGSVHDYIKKHKLVSRIGSVIPHPGVQTASRVASALGYGAGVVEQPPYYESAELAGGRRKKKNEK